MSLGSFIKKQFIDVLQWNEDSDGTLAWRYPMEDFEIQYGASLTVRDALPHMIERGSGDILVTSSLAAHYPTPWEPVYASSKWAIDCFVQTTRRQVFRHGLRVGSISPGPVLTGLIADWPADRLAEARASGSLIEPAEIGAVITFMLTRPRGVTIRDVVLMPSNFDL